VQLDWTTFLLEIGNFLILVWILQRFLYRPVLEVIARRREGIEKTLADAKRREDEAHELDAQARQRLEDWQGEREAARAKLAEEIAAERVRRLQQVEESVKTEREKGEALAARRAGEERRELEAQALEQGTLFASRLLERLAGPGLDSQIVHAIVDDLQGLPDDQRSAIADAAARPDAHVQIDTARPLNAEDRQRLSEALQGLFGRTLEEQVHETPELIAGLRVAIGPWVLAANLRDELAFFRGGARRVE
jgi:F-type H+-transporting ATPase subunit b